MNNDTKTEALKMLSVKGNTIKYIAWHLGISIYSVRKLKATI